jgi:thiol-disulfide isomerase/thioredoxin
MTDKARLVGDALAELVEQTRAGGPRVRVGLMAVGSELGAAELLHGAALAMAQDPRLQVVAIGARVPGYDTVEWIETLDSERDVVRAMESALVEGRIAGAVALHYTFPLGVTTIGRVLTPARGRPMLIASCTGMSAATRTEAMLRNALYGIAVARALGTEEPTVGVLNLDGAASVQRALERLSQNGYLVDFGSSLRADGGSLLRGNDVLAGATDICVCDTLTGNVMVKLISAFNSGGTSEVIGWGYGPSVGAGWARIVSIISRASAAPVVANALSYTASVIRGQLARRVEAELAAAKASGLDEVIRFLAAVPVEGEDVSAPPPAPTDSEIQGIDVLSLQAAVKELWKAGIYAESAMGCTGPVVKVPSSSVERSREVLSRTGHLEGTVAVDNPKGKSSMLAIDAENYQSTVLASDLPVVVDLWGPRCRPCLALMPQVETMAEEYEGKVRFAKINVMENRRLAISLQVMGVPAFLFYAGGEERERMTGEEITLEAIRAGVDRLLT